MPSSYQPGIGRRRFIVRLLAATSATVTVSALGGCGDSNGTSSVMPTDPKDFPENRAKASMDFARQQLAKKKKK